ncbi:hypothetical protein A6V39_05265 [Candidatus Mycoplasma haematobovis]|uniref:Uncharacterized protein n=1 Tax=Candidatus Mycoplasma haematobovis TaxID=432608 RepID=A0A1A9QC70_9MOLU|nr:hypothetical protein [Candidatus Mycoplasma haematobovis]OAL09838.1 hypothetical protein A6V39_05265 [Candidatus Mycoplasma haematobovis]
MTILPHHIAGIFLLGGLTVGGYFTVIAFTPPSLESKLSQLGLEVLKGNWGDKEDAYQKASEDLITSIPKNGAGKIDGFVNKLEDWCNKYKTKNFLGENDANYKRFSRWCTVTKKIQEVLKKRGGFADLDAQEKANMFRDYSADTNTDNKFVIPAKAPLQESDLNKWCDTKKEEVYKYESDQDLQRVIKWCYKKA